MKRFLWIVIFSVAFLGLTPTVFGRDKDKDDQKKKEEEARRNKADLLKEMMLKPKDTKLIRFTNFVCPDGHYTGEYGSGVCFQLLQAPDGSPSTCNKRLSRAPRKMRTRWQGKKLIVVGQISEKMPENLRLELSLRYFRPSGSVFSWKEVRSNGKARRKWRTFKTEFVFPKRKTTDYTTQRGRLKTLRFRVQILDGEYWLEARFVKSKQSRMVRKKITQLEMEIPDYKCLDCGKSFMTPIFVRCPNCNRKLTRPTRRYPKKVYKDGKWVWEGKIHLAFICRKCNIEVPIKPVTECKYCQSKNIIPTKKDRQIYLEGMAKVYAPKPDYDPSNPGSQQQFNQTQDKAKEMVQKHYSDIIKAALKANTDLDHSFGSAYKSVFMKNGKFDQKNWKSWVFASLYWRRIKADSPKGRRLFRELVSDNKFLRNDKFDSAGWDQYIKDDFQPTITKLILKHYSYKQSALALPYPKSQVYLNRLLWTILHKGLISYPGQLYSANHLEHNSDMPPIPGAGRVSGISPKVLNNFFKKIDREVHLMDYWKNH